MFQQGYHKLWLQKQIAILYHAFLVILQQLLTAFPSSYLLKERFIAVMTLIIKKIILKNPIHRLEISARGHLWLLLTNIEMEINTFIKSHHVLPSH